MIECIIIIEFSFKNQDVIDSLVQNVAGCKQQDPKEHVLSVNWFQIGCLISSVWYCPPSKYKTVPIFSSAALTKTGLIVSPISRLAVIRSRPARCAASFLECAATTQRTVRPFTARVQVYTRTLRFMRLPYAVCSSSFGFESHTARVFACACELPS
jgi:hypothetical protein